jgi:hypothetical protein
VTDEETARVASLALLCKEAGTQLPADFTVEPAFLEGGVVADTIPGDWVTFGDRALMDDFAAAGCMVLSTSVPQRHAIVRVKLPSSRFVAYEPRPDDAARTTSSVNSG